jgi:hypothetical protein
MALPGKLSNSQNFARKFPGKTPVADGSNTRSVTSTQFITIITMPINHKGSISEANVLLSEYDLNL